MWVLGKYDIMRRHANTPEIGGKFMKSINAKLINKKAILRLVPVLVLAITISALIFVGNATAESENAKDNLATIVFTNDVHANISGAKTTDGLSFSSAVQLEKDSALNSEATYLVDAGDHMWASKYSSCGPERLGRDIIDIMRTANYDFVVPGNHEYEYGINFFKDSIVNRANAAESGDQKPYNYYACNYFNKKGDGSKGERILDAYKIIDVASTGKKLALIGIATPESAFPDWEFNNQMFDTGEALHADVQQAINDCKDAGADYIIAVAHLGIYSSAEAGEYSSKQVIAHTSGLNAVIDGHSHMAYNTEYNDKEGNHVKCIQAGTQFNNIGKVTIDLSGNITTELIQSYDGKDATVHAAENNLINYVETYFQAQTANSDITFPFANDDGTKIASTKETSLGDLVADALYWTANNTESIDGENKSCDFTLVNSNLISAGFDKGIYTIDDASKCVTDSCDFVVANITGQQVLNVLEWGFITDYHPETNTFEPWRHFPHVAGIKFDVNCNIPSTVQVDWTSPIVQYYGPQWIGAPTGEYRVSNVQIYNKDTQQYEPLEMNKIYKFGTISCIVKTSTEGYKMLSQIYHHLYDCTTYEAIAYYFNSFAENQNSEANALPSITSANSPLASMPNYLINYEDENGSGRITFNYENPQPQPDVPASDVTSTSSTGDNTSVAIFCICLIFIIAGIVYFISRKKGINVK